MLKKLQKATMVAAMLVASSMPALHLGDLYAQDNVPENLMLFTDLHYLAPNLMNNGGANLQKEIDNDNKMFDKAADVLQALVNKALSNKPVGVLISGDLTKNGEKYSHNEVAAKLQELVDAGIKVWVVPGNHDVNNADAKTFAGGMVRTVSTPTSAEFATIYANMGYNDCIERDPNSLSYVCEPLPGLHLICVDDNMCMQRDKNRSLDANGISANTLNWILAKADAAKDKGKQVMVMMHHQLVPHIDDQESLLGDGLVADADNVRASFLAHGIHLVLTGHIHISNATTWYTANKADKIVEVTTGSVIAYPCHVRNITMNDARNEITFSTSSINKTLSDANFATYALNRAKEGTRATVSSIIWHNWEEISGMLSDYGASLDFDRFVDATYGGLGDMISELTIAMSKGNEQNSGVTPSSIKSKMDAGSDKVVDDLLADQNFLVRLMAKSVVKGRFHDLLDEAINSALTDQTRIGTPLQDRTDDLSPVVTLPTPKQVALTGDVNNDGGVDIVDVNLLVSVVLGSINPSALAGDADVNGDGTVDAVDINACLNIVLNN